MSRKKILFTFYAVLLLSIILGVNEKLWSQNLHIAITFAITILAVASTIGTIKQIEDKTLKIDKGDKKEGNRFIALVLLGTNLFVCVIIGAWIRVLLWFIILTLSSTIYYSMKEYRLTLKKETNENQN